MKTTTCVLSKFLWGCIGVLLLLKPDHCQAKSLLRGPSDQDVFLLVQETKNIMLEQISSFQREQKELVTRIESLEQERQELMKRVHILEEQVQQQQTLASENPKERHLSANSCIVEDNREGGRFVVAGCNLYVQSGGGRTDAITGRGNLIVGYDELENTATVRSGSHNVIIGIGHQYKGHSGLVAGRSNSLNAAYSSIIGGHNNAVDGSFASIAGGTGNVATGDASHVSGGANNMAIGVNSAVLGGYGTTAVEMQSAVVGG